MDNLKMSKQKIKKPDFVKGQLEENAIDVELRERANSVKFFDFK